MIKLNLGCGHIQPEGWVNVDGSMRAWLATRFSWFDHTLTNLKILPKTEFNSRTHYANLNKRLQWKDGTVDCIFLGEVLEHFTKDDGYRLLRECYRILKPGGIIRLRVPDNVQFWRKYIDEYDLERCKPRDRWSESHERWIELFFHDICVSRTLFRSMGHYHKWMYDEITLLKTIEKAGFTGANRRKQYDSAIPGIHEVETYEYLTVEAIKE